MKMEREGILISTEPERLDLDFISSGLNRTYWAGGRRRDVIEESIRNSVCFGVYDEAAGKQVGFARVVTDKATVALVCDVFIDEAYRGRGLGKWLMSCVTAHPDVRNTVSVLATRDAHGLYEKFGYVRGEIMRRPPGGQGPGEPRGGDPVPKAGER